MRILCITGMRGCGKTVFGEVARGEGHPIYEMRNIVVELMNEQNIIVNNRNIREFAKNLREQYGKSIVAEKMVEKINGGGKKDVAIIVGIRGMYEIRTFREAFGDENVIIVAIHSSPRTRFERVMKRTNKSDDPKTYDEFLWSEEMELGYGVSKVIALADRMIVNESSLEEYISCCKKLLEEVRI